MQRSIFRSRQSIAKLFVPLLFTLFMVWPLTAIAGEVLTVTGAAYLQVPFVPSWTTIWFFALGGGFMSNFVKLDVDSEFRAVFIAKPLIGILFSVAIVMYFTGDAPVPSPSMAIAALGCAFVGAPLMQAVLLYITKSDLIVRAMESLYARFFGGR